MRERERERERQLTHLAPPTRLSSVIRYTPTRLSSVIRYTTILPLR